MKILNFSRILERELNTCCRRILDLLDLCLYFNEQEEETEAIDEDQKPGFIKRSGLRVEGPNGLTNSFLVAIFATLIQVIKSINI